MPAYSNSTDRVERVILPAEVTRAFWSRRRAHHGDEVQLFVETVNIPDGTPFKVEVWEDDSGEGSPDDFIVEVEGDHRIEDSRCIIDYTLEWDEASLGAELETEGDEMEFYFKVTIDTFNIDKRSTLLYVDLNEFIVSS